MINSSQQQEISINQNQRQIILKDLFKKSTKYDFRETTKLNNESNFLHKIRSTNRQVSSFRNAFAYSSPSNIKLSKTQIWAIMQSGRFLGRVLGTLVKAGLPLMKSVIKPLSKYFLISVVLTTKASTTDARIHIKLLFWEGKHWWFKTKRWKT